MISANGGLRAHRYTPQVTQRWPRGSEPASAGNKAGVTGIVLVMGGVVPIPLRFVLARLH